MPFRFLAAFCFAIAQLSLTGNAQTLSSDCLAVAQGQAHAADFAKSLQWNLRGQKPVCDSLWVNVLPQGGSHTSHIHTNAVLSGTYYVTAPEGSSPIVFEDPRHAMMMAAPPRKTSVYESRVPKAGTLMLWESWLRHEVPMNRAKEDRISVSFNCGIG